MTTLRCGGIFIRTLAANLTPIFESSSTLYCAVILKIRCSNSQGLLLFLDVEMGQKKPEVIFGQCPFNGDLISAVESQMKDFGNSSAFLEVNYNGKCLFAVVHVLLRCCASKTSLIFSAIQNTKK